RPPAPQGRTYARKNPNREAHYQLPHPVRLTQAAQAVARAAPAVTTASSRWPTSCPPAPRPLRLEGRQEQPGAPPDPGDRAQDDTQPDRRDHAPQPRNLGIRVLP